MSASDSVVYSVSAEGVYKPGGVSQEKASTLLDTHTRSAHRHPEHVERCRKDKSVLFRHIDNSQIHLVSANLCSLLHHRWHIGDIPTILVALEGDLFKVPIGPGTGIGECKTSTDHAEHPPT